MMDKAWVKFRQIWYLLTFWLSVTSTNPDKDKYQPLEYKSLISIRPEHPRKKSCAKSYDLDAVSLF